MPSEDESSPLRKPYTLDEDIKIIAYIIESDSFNKVKGVTFWMNVEKALGKKGSKRSWQSLKERFRRTIIPNIAQYDIDDKSKAKLLAPFSPVKIKQSQKKITGHRRPYTLAEDESLARYILRNPGKDFRGNVIWKSLEKDKVVKGRSWMSMRNRFLTYVSCHLFEVLNSDDALAVKRIIRGDLSFVDYCSSDEEYLKTAAGKKHPLMSHKSRDDLKQANDSALPSRSRELPSRLPTSLIVDSDSNDSTLAPPRKKILRVIESEEDLSDSSLPPTFSRVVICSASPVNSSGSAMPIVLLQRCDAVTDNHEKTGSSQSTLFNAATVVVKGECCCDDLDPPRGDPSAFCSSGCRALVGPTVPLSVMTAEAMLRADQPTQEDDRVSELMPSTKTVEGPQRTKPVQAVQYCREPDTPQTDKALTQATERAYSVSVPSSRESAETAFQFSKNIKKLRKAHRCLQASPESKEALPVPPLEQRDCILVKSGRRTGFEDCGPGHTRIEERECSLMVSEDEDPETPMENMIDYLASIDDCDEPETFVDPLNRVTGANIILMNGTNMSLGIPKFPVLNIL